MVVVVAAGVLLAGLGCGQGDRSGVMPSVVGMNRKDATSAIVDVGLRWRAARSPVVAAKAASVGVDDLVVRQSPPAGAALELGAVVVIQTCVTSPGVGCERIAPDASNAAPLG